MTDHERAYLESVERQLWEMSQLALERGEPWPLAEGPLTPNEATE